LPFAVSPRIVAGMDEGAVGGWSRRARIGLAVGLLAAALLRLALLPTMGLRDDTDQFVGWVHQLATGLPLGDAYRLDLSFPPVMVYVFWALAHLVPAFGTAADAGDLAARIAIKVPASLADLGLALGVAYLLRERPRWAIGMALAVAFVPLTWYVSAWWGQFESIYVLLGLLAVILVLADHPIPATAALGLAVMTKPQALPFLVPFAAYALGRYGWRRAAFFGIVAGAVAAATWLPFLADGGPSRYLANLGHYQDQVFGVLSLRAWNAWWLVQEPATDGAAFLSDTGQLLGPLTPRMLGYAFAALGELAVFLAILRRPTRDGLLLGLAASVLVAFCFLTTMHERYSYGAVIFLAAATSGRMRAAAWTVLAAAATANAIAAIPPSTVPGSLIPLGGPIGIAGSLAFLGVGAAVIAELQRREPAGVSEAATAGAGP
jgi:Gpi18-like mannosyltransferase